MVPTILTSISHYNKICRDEKKPLPRINSYQLNQLKKTLLFAEKNIPYYREVWGAARLDVSRVKSWENFNAIPLLTKQELRSRRAEDFLPESIPYGLWKSQTTGSTGIPIQIFRSPQTDAWTKALLHYSFSVVGIKVNDRFCQILHYLSEKPHPKGFLAKIGLKRYYPVSLKLSDEEMVRSIKEVNPDVLYSFPSVLLRLAEYIDQESIDLQVKCVFGQGEYLPPAWRARIEKAFKAPMYHSYGSTEFPRIGYECHFKTGFHLLPQPAVVEILREDGTPVKPGEEGEIVLTHLNNYTMPLIRYRIGDKGILSARPCPCGSHYPLLESLTGRMDDYLIMADGKKLSARAFTHMEFEGILQHKIIQKNPGLFEVLVIPSNKFGQDTVKAIENQIRLGCLDEKMKVIVKTVESLPVSRTGKFQLVSREF